MIIYEPNKNWFRDIGNLARSWTMQKIVRGVLLIGAISSATCLSLYYFGIEPSLHSGMFSLLGIVLSILLVFRTNTAYDRWWEGRKQWGSLVNNTRTLATMLQACLPHDDKESRYYFAKHISNFGLALKEHLRTGVRLEDLVGLEPSEVELLKHRQHIPNQIGLWIYERIHFIYRERGISDADLINLKPQYFALLDVMGACERIKKNADTL
jgi:ion channel-forming bestrophin family protein